MTFDPTSPNKDLADANPIVKMKAKYNGRCSDCHDSIYVGESIYYDTLTRDVFCEHCGREH